VTVHNTGNGLDSIVIKNIIGAPSGWLTYTQPPEVTLLQDQEAMVKIIVIVPSTFEEAPIGMYNLTVPAESSRSDAHAEFYLEIEIIQFYRIEWTDYGMRPLRSFNPYEKSSIYVTRQLMNFGNGRTMVSLGWNTTDHRIELSFEIPLIEMDIDETRSIRVDIKVSTNLPPGRYTVHINATSHEFGAVTRTSAIEFDVENYDALVPPIPVYFDEREFVRYPLKREFGENITFKLKVENNGTRPLSGVKVKVFDIYWVEGEEVRWNFFNFTTPSIAVGDRFLVGERPFTVTNPPLYWWSNRTGNHTLEFRVYYPYQSNTDNDVARLNVTVQKIPNGDVDDGGYRLPSIRWVIIGILFLMIISATALGLREWFKELRKPLRPR
jgi:uncharacterized membrane protein